MRRRKKSESKAAREALNLSTSEDFDRISNNIAIRDGREESLKEQAEWPDVTRLWLLELVDGIN